MASKEYFYYILDYLPLPQVLLSGLLFLIYCPLTNGYEYIYNICIKKLLKTYEESIDKYLKMAKDEISDKGKRVKNEAVDTVVENLLKQKEKVD